MECKPFILHALSPLHAGTGQALDIIDLPIARMRSNKLPFVPGSSVKGVLRDARCHAAKSASGASLDDVLAVFGPESDKADEYAAALVVSDARLLALPVRSFRGVFAWVTSPLLLGLARRDLLTMGNCPAGKLPGEPPVPQAGHALCASLAQSVNSLNQQVYLEDLDFNVAQDPAAGAWAGFLAPHVLSAPAGTFASRFLIVPDESMSFLWETATQVDTRVRLDDEKRTVVKGALWTEESLPPETLLLGLLFGQESRRKGHKLNANQVLNIALPAAEVLQFGGKATVGRGLCRMVPV